VQIAGKQHSLTVNTLWQRWIYYTFNFRLDTPAVDVGHDALCSVQRPAVSVVPAYVEASGQAPAPHVFQEICKSVFHLTLYFPHPFPSILESSESAGELNAAQCAGTPSGEIRHSLPAWSIFHASCCSTKAELKQ
jgi:hypothetical protein